MGAVILEEDIHKEIKEYIEKHNIDYPSIQNFVNKTCRDHLKELKLREVPNNAKL